MSDPPFLLRRAAIQAMPELEDHYQPPFDGEKLCFGRELGRAVGARALGAWEERLPPGRRTSFTHAHLREEELVYVVAGRPSLRWMPPGEAAQETELEPGDFIGFPAGTGIAHTFWNRTEADAVLLVVGERSPSERVSYPEDAPFEAWRNEQKPQKAWPDEAGPTGEARWPAERIETARLVLRPWRAIDTPALWALQNTNRAHLGRFMAWARATPTLDEHLATVRGFGVAFAEGRDLVYGIFLPNGRPIGGTGFHPRVGPHGIEIGYWIDQGHEGQGYITECTAALCRLAFEIKKVQVVEIHCDRNNLRSAAVPKRLGFTLSGVLPGRHVDPDGAPVDTEVYSLRAADRVVSVAAPVVCRAWDALGRRLI